MQVRSFFINAAVKMIFNSILDNDSKIVYFIGSSLNSIA